MRITRLHIENFRSIRTLDIELGDTTVFIGPNNAGKTAIIDAVRILLTRRWGQRGTGFIENDVHRPDPGSDPRTLPPVKIVLKMLESQPGQWPPDMVADLEDIMTLLPDRRNLLTVQVTYTWNPEKEVFDPAWQFLDSVGNPLQERHRAINLAKFFDYMPLLWLGPLRDAFDEFTPRSGQWGRLLRSVRIPDDLEADALRILTELDARIIVSDPRLTSIANIIGEATRIAIGEGPGAARLNTLPLTIEEMLQRTGIVLRNEEQLPWLPLSHHGHGLQSLAVIFLFKAAVLQQLAEADRPGVEAIFAIEEPEAHLHPQAARTLWNSIQELSGQKLMTTHSPHFVQNVPLRDLRLVCLRGGCTQVTSIPHHVVSDLPWSAALNGLVNGAGRSVFYQDISSNRIAARCWFDIKMAKRLLRCYRRDPDLAQRTAAIRRLRHDCRILPSNEDEEALHFHGRRVRGEIFFSRRWILVEGVDEYLLIHALGKALRLPLDAHGISVIDFQQSGSPGVYAALAESFGIPWHMIVDGGAEAAGFRQQLLNRGFEEADLTGHFSTLPPPNKLEDQLISDGHEPMLRQILAEIGIASAPTCSLPEFRAHLKNRKTEYMSILSLRVAADPALALRMPAPFVALITELREV